VSINPWAANSFISVREFKRTLNTLSSLWICERRSVSATELGVPGEFVLHGSVIVEILITPLLLRLEKLLFCK
jgi:hypothetical protein